MAVACRRPAGVRVSSTVRLFAWVAPPLDQAGLDQPAGQARHHRRGDQQPPSDLGLRQRPLAVDDAQHVVLLVRELLPGSTPAGVGQQVAHDLWMVAIRRVSSSSTVPAPAR